MSVDQGGNIRGFTPNVAIVVPRSRAAGYIGASTNEDLSKPTEGIGTGSINVTDEDGTLNSWDDVVRGNYRSDYRARYPGATATEGVWSTPYSIPGSTGSVDRFPLVDKIDWLPPVADVASAKSMYHWRYRATWEAGMVWPWPSVRLLAVASTPSTPPPSALTTIWWA